MPPSLEQSPENLTKRLVSLDGLRAIAILAVVAGHLVGTPDYPVRDVTPRVFAMAHMGVQVFFVLSGYLITTILMGAQERRRPSILTFIRRRGYRILPAYLFYLGVLVVLRSIGLNHIQWGDFLAPVIYLSNVFPPQSWLLVHTWSLSVEEQFYVVWPILIKTLSRRLLIISAAMFVVVPSILQIVGHRIFRFQHLEEFLPTSAAVIATGCLSALARRRPSVRAKIAQIMSSQSRQVLVGLVPIAAIALPEFPTWTALLRGPVSNIAIAATISGLVDHPSSILTKLLSGRLICGLGAISYSVYLWQQIFLDRYANVSINHFPGNVIMSVCVALVSYNFVERPFLRLRDRAMPPTTN